MVRRYDPMHPSPLRGWWHLLLLAALFLPCLAHAETAVWLVAPDYPPPIFGAQQMLDCSDPQGTLRFCIYGESDVAIHGVSWVYADFVFRSTSPRQCPGNDPPPALPPFWLFWAPDATCNENGMVWTADPPPTDFGIPSLWGASPQSFQWDSAVSADTLRESYSIWAPFAPRDMEANRIYYMGQLVLSKCAGQTCRGCDASVQLDMWAGVADGVNGHDLGVTSAWVNVYGVCGTVPSPDPSVLRSLRSPQPKSAAATVASVCDPVPVRRHAWGDLKLRYR
jgi:hypothetical protein